MKNFDFARIIFLKISGTQIWISKYIQKDKQSTLCLKDYRRFGRCYIKYFQGLSEFQKRTLKNGFQSQNFKSHKRGFLKNRF